MVADLSPPTSDNNLLLRQMQVMRRDMHKVMEREARVELLGRMNLWLDELMTRTERGFSEIRGDLLLMENRILTAIIEVRRLAGRFETAAEEVD